MKVLLRGSINDTTTIDNSAQLHKTKNVMSSNNKRTKKVDNRSYDHDDSDEEDDVKGDDVNLGNESTEEDNTEEDNENLSSCTEVESTVENEEQDSDEEPEKLNDKTTQPKSKTMIEYMLDNGERGQATILTKQPKKTGSSKSWVNIYDIEQDKESSINWDRIEWWREKESEHVLVCQINESEEAVVEAKEKEMQNMIDNRVFEWVEDQGQSTVSCKWVLTEKVKYDGSSFVKARLVARGFEESNYARTDSPTCSKQSIRMIFTTASCMSWELYTLDVTSAFLQGNKMEREVYVKPPLEFAEPGKVWRLVRCLYGLCDAPRSWYKRIDSELKTLGGVVSQFDNALFLWHDDEGVLEGILAIHVDDFVYCGTSSWLKDVIKNIVTIFKISKSAQGCFPYLGLNVIQTRDSVLIDQCKYVDESKKIVLEAGKQLKKDEKLNEKEKKELRRVSGQLIWLTSNTRPDSAFDSCWVSNYGKDPTVKNILAANKAIDKVKKNQVRIVFPDLGNPQYWEVFVYSDVTHASLPSGASQGAYIILCL